MITHHVLAFAIASEAVRRIRGQQQPWSEVLSHDVYSTSARGWPLPDFVIVDSRNSKAVAGEFKPPDQSKREYLTGLGQAVAYTRDFDYAILVVPRLAEDGYRIAEHIHEVLAQPPLLQVPVGLVCYDERVISAQSAPFDVLHALTARQTPVVHRGTTSESFWAKWRDISPEEMGIFLNYLYEEGRSNAPGTPRDRAFDRLWADILAQRTHHWSGGVRSVANTRESKVAWGKNYRNFVSHIGWTLADGKLTEEGLRALHLAHIYGSDSRIFLDHIALTVLMGGKHLVLINAINEFQDARQRSGQPIQSEDQWRLDIEAHLDLQGLVKRNPGRHAAAVQQVPRDFMKAENTLWKNLGFIVGRGARAGRVYHPGRGYVFDWARITSLLS